MKFLIVSNAPLIIKRDKFFAYAPYIKEMGIWAKYTDEVAFCCPLWKNENELLVTEVPFFIEKNFWLYDFNVTSVKSIFKAFFQVIFNFFMLIRAMIWADHIHLRCPGNVGLLASIVQICFFWKIKTVKYAGNWDPNAKQPWTYKLQKWILANTFLTKNMQVLVYGNWPKQSKNIKPFFTATYKASEQKPITPKIYDDTLKFVFVGMLSTGKRPLYAVKLIEKLKSLGWNVQLEIYGEGTERIIIEDYIRDINLCENVFLKGNQNLETIKKAYQENHFVILPSKSEGWPKVIAEAMFWGCVPIATKVSCVPNMLDYGKRGIQLHLAIEEDCNAILELVNDRQTYNQMCVEGINWSRQFTIDHFEQEIAKLLKN